MSVGDEREVERVNEWEKECKFWFKVKMGVLEGSFDLRKGENT